MSRVAAPRAAVDRPNRWRVLVRRQRRRMRPVMVLAGLGGIAFAFMLVVGAVGRGDNFSERFGEVTGRLGLRLQKVDYVEVNKKTPKAAIDRALGFNLGDPILPLDLAAGRARVEQIQWVAHATVTRHLPGVVEVQTEERSPFAVWQHDGKFVLIDREGNVVTDSDVAAFARELPLVVGAGAPEAAAAMVEALNKQPTLLPKVSALVRVGARRWNIRTPGGTDVLLPEGAEALALRRLAQLQASDGVLDRPLEAIDMRLPDRLTLRPFPDATPPVVGRRPS